MNFLGSVGAHRKDKGFSSKNKVQQYHGDGSETIIMMGCPFRVLQKISDVVPPYVVGRQRKAKYGENGNSYVYLVENTNMLPEFPRHLALKRSFFAVDQVAVAHKEIDIFSRVKDKNIVRVFHSEISRNEGKLGVSVAMEYCSNNLYRRIRSGSTTNGTPLTESDVCHVLFAVTSAVGYLHSKQPPIAHRNIVPENIMINNNNSGPMVYKLTNFSSACTEAYLCETREEASMAIEDIQNNTNPSFRAPEMADPWKKQRICEKVDLWSIGVLLYYMMYLRLPFDPAATMGRETWKLQFPAQSRGSFTGSLSVILRHLLDPNPESRWDIFALTNFLRFDEDVSRHLGTFCFTKTEWPEGWEAQDVKVLNRVAPPKEPPVSYGESGHEQLDRRTTSSPPSAAPASPSPHSGPADRTFDGNAVQDAMMVLGGDPADDDPEMAQYRQQIIREQEQAWEQAKAAAAGTSAPGASAVAAVEAEAPPPPKDVFDDLFAGPAQPASPPPAAAAAAPQLPPPNASGVQQQAPLAKDMFSADDLFSAPPPPPQSMQPEYAAMTMNPYGQPQQQPISLNDGWSSGAPAMAHGASHPLPPQQQHPMSGYPMGGPMSNAPMNQVNFSPAPMMPPQQQMDFMAPAPGVNPTAKPADVSPKPAPAATATRKDPFADLFN